MSQISGFISALATQYARPKMYIVELSVSVKWIHLPYIWREKKTCSIL